MKKAATLNWLSALDDEVAMLRKHAGMPRTETAPAQSAADRLRDIAECGFIGDWLLDRVTCNALRALANLPPYATAAEAQGAVLKAVTQ